MNQQTADWAKNIVNNQQKKNLAARDAEWDQFGGAPGKNTNPAYYSNGTSTEAWKSQPGALTATRMKDPVLVNGLYYDRSYGKPAGQSQPSANTSQPRTAVSGTMTYSKPLTRMQQAVRTGVNTGRISTSKNSAILNQMLPQPNQFNPSGSQFQQLYDILNSPSKIPIPMYPDGRPMPVPHAGKSNIIAPNQFNPSSSQLQQLYNNLNRTSQSADFNGDGIMDNVSIVPGANQVKIGFGGSGAYQY